MLRLIESGWVRIKVALDVRDPLRPTRQPFELPEDFHELSIRKKRQLTICNLFANHGQAVGEISRYFEISPKEVVRTLIDEGLLKEQRRKRTEPIKNGRRETDRVISPDAHLPVDP